MAEQKHKIRIVLADDHALVLEGLRGLLEREPDMEVAGAFTDGVALLDALERDCPDVVVLDIEMPAQGGLSCLEAIRRAAWPVKVVILTAFGDGSTLQSAWAGQADGFALKTDPPRQTVATIRNVAHGQIVFPRAVRQAAVSAGQPTQRLSQLTRREYGVLELLADGLTNAQIAERLTVQESTVKFHVQNIFQKLGAANRTEAANIYLREREK
jgi:DNA-binding NarL/FixJ family response regulator